MPFGKIVDDENRTLQMRRVRQDRETGIGQAPLVRLQSSRAVLHAQRPRPEDNRPRVGELWNRQARIGLTLRLTGAELRLYET